jgi:hypothetical protein
MNRADRPTCYADRPRRRRGPSSPLRGPSVKHTQNTRSDPRKTDRPPRPGGPSAPPTDRSLLERGPSANWLQPKQRAKPDRKQRRARTRRRRDELEPRGLSASTPRTVRQVRTEQKQPDPESQLPQIIIGFPKRLKLWRKGFGDLKSVTQGCYSPKILPPNSLNQR